MEFVITTGLLIMLGVLALVAISIIWDSWRSGKPFCCPIPRPFQNRGSQEALWQERHAGETVTADAVLRMLCDTFTFNSDDRYKFTPDDRYIDIYRGCYSRWKIADCMETESFGMNLKKRFGIDISERLSAITLGEIVDLASHTR